MNRGTALRLLLVLILAACAGYILIGKSDEDKIKDIAHNLVEVSKINGPEHPLERIAAVKKALRYADRELQFAKEEQEYTYDQDALLAKGVQLRTLFSELETKIDIESIELNENGEAKVIVVGSAMGEIISEDGPFFDQHRVAVSLVKKDSNWFIKKVTHIKNLRDT